MAFGQARGLLKGIFKSKGFKRELLGGLAAYFV